MHEEVRPAYYKILVAYVVALHFDVNLIQREDYIFLKIIAFLHIDDFHVSQRNKIVYVILFFFLESPTIFEYASNVFGKSPESNFYFCILTFIISRTFPFRQLNCKQLS